MTDLKPLPEKNAIRAKAAFEAGELVLDSLPSRLTVESTAICNLRCVMCPQGIGAVDRPKHMSIEMFAKMAEPMGQASSVQLHGIGEPLSSPSFWYGMENDLLSDEADVAINTNLTLLNERRLHRLAETNLKLSLNISLDAATPATYRRIRGADFEETVNNIRRLRTARGDRRYPEMRINMTLMRENIEEVVRFIELASDLRVDAACFWHLNRMPDDWMAKYSVDREDWHFEYAEQGLWNYPALSDRMLRAAVRRAKELGVPVHFDESKNTFFDEGECTPTAEATSTSLETVRHCTHPWDAFLVSSNGEARTCCFSKPIGNLNDQSFLEIWNGPVMQRLRRDIKQDRVNPICSDAACKYVANSATTAPAPEPDPHAASATTLHVQPERSVEPAEQSLATATSPKSKAGESLFTTLVGQMAKLWRRPN